MASRQNALTMAGMDADLPRWTSICEHLRRFERDYCPAVMPPLTILNGSDRTWTDAEYQARRPAGFPDNMRGVYLLFDPTETLLYVGVAMWSFDKRVWAHDEWGSRRYIDVIPFSDRWLPLALSLEFVLIQALHPPENTTYRNYGLPQTDGHEPIPSPAKDANG